LLSASAQPGRPPAVWRTQLSGRGRHRPQASLALNADLTASDHSYNLSFFGLGIDVASCLVFRHEPANGRLKQGENPLTVTKRGIGL
jgi:hypothetical protein